MERSAAVRSFGLSWPLLLAALGFLASLNNSVLVDPDTFWHVATARWIFAHGAIPAVDPFSFSAAGKPWIAHEWLAAVILGAAQGLMGWTGPAAVAAASFAAAMALVCRYLLRYLEPIYAICLTCLAGLLVQDHLLARPHALVLPILAFWCIKLLDARQGGRAPGWTWALLMVLWANLHGSFPLGLGLVAFFGMEAVVAAPAAERRQAALAWGAFFLAAFLAALATPHGWQGFAFLLHLNGMGYTLDNLGEWRSPNFHLFQPLEVAIMMAAAAVFWRGLRLPPLRALLVLGLLHLALVHVRHVEILGLVVPLAVAESLGRQWGRQAGTGKAATLDCWFDALATPARSLSCALVMVVLAAISALFAMGEVLEPPAHNRPEAAVKAAQAAVPGGRVLNEYHFGGYLIFSGIPTYIDGRADMFGDDFFANYHRAVTLEEPEKLLELLRRHDISWTLLPPERPAVALLDRLPDWRRLYADENAVVHVKSPQK